MPQECARPRAQQRGKHGAAVLFAAHPKNPWLAAAGDGRTPPVPVRDSPTGMGDDILLSNAAFLQNVQSCNRQSSLFKPIDNPANPRPPLNRRKPLPTTPRLRWGSDFAHSSRFHSAPFQRRPVNRSTGWGCDTKFFQWGDNACCRAKAERRSALHDAARARFAAASPPGLGVRARQRRLPARARRFVQEPVHQLHAHPSRRKRLEEFCLTPVLMHELYFAGSITQTLYHAAVP